MAQYLLVHGAWHGAWCWQDVSEGLIRAGHSAHALTLTGLGERSHLLHRGIDLETHVQDVLQALDAQEMQDAILVVHSYAGMLGTAVADRRVASVPRTFINCTLPPLATIDAVRRRVIDPQFWDGLWIQNASVIEMKTGHDPMISAPKELTALLLACADQ